MALKATGVSYVDVLLVAGQYQVNLFIPGSEAAGIVVQTGTDVSSVQPGDRVLVPAGFAEAVVAAEHVTTLPDTVSFETAAAFRSTTHVALQRGRLKAGGSWCNCGWRGRARHGWYGRNCSVPRSLPASSEEKLAVCKQQGADHVINYTHGFREQIKELTGDRGVDVIFDPVGGDVFRRIHALYCAIRTSLSWDLPAVAGLAKTNHLLIKCRSHQLHDWRMSRHDPPGPSATSTYSWAGSPPANHAVCVASHATGTSAISSLILERKVIGKAVLV